MESEKYRYVYRDYPPYEIISNDFISYEELSELKCVENALERYYNSGSFKHSLNVVFEKINDVYDVFKNTGDYMKNNYPTGYGFSKQMLFDILFDVYNHLGEDFVSALKKDYLLSFRPGKRPHWMGKHDEACTLKAYELFKNEEIKLKYFPEYAGVPAKEIMKHIHAESFGDDILLFDYKKSAIYNMNLYNNC